MEGAGQDVQKVGEKVEDRAEGTGTDASAELIPRFASRADRRERPAIAGFFVSMRWHRRNVRDRSRLNASAK